MRSGPPYRTAPYRRDSRSRAEPDRRRPIRSGTPTVCGRAGSVVEEAGERGGRGDLQALLRLLALAPAVDEARLLVRQEAAAVRQEDLEVGMALEHPCEDQAGGGDRGIERVADEVAEIIILQPVGRGRCGRVDEDQVAELRRGGPDRFRARIVESAAPHVRA